MNCASCSGEVSSSQKFCPFCGAPVQAGVDPDEGHAIALPAHQHDIQKRLVAWFDKYLR